MKAQRVGLDYFCQPLHYTKRFWGEPWLYEWLQFRYMYYGKIEQLVKNKLIVFWQIWQLIWNVLFIRWHYFVYCNIWCSSSEQRAFVLITIQSVRWQRLNLLYWVRMHSLHGGRGWKIECKSTVCTMARIGNKWQWLDFVYLMAYFIQYTLWLQHGLVCAVKKSAIEDWKRRKTISCVNIKTNWKSICIFNW